ncbi:MAG TPA: Crp/Fnr family transcriptional regulator [Pseudobdellovibrionaceae bacterium]|nr:Crp/Fnr family transcriptional regulator [Pseudobdellovibrionaceae bacterium]
MTAVEAALGELSQFPLFQKFSREKLLQLVSDSQIVVTNHREVLFRCGEKASCFGIVLGGAYKLIKPGTGGEDTILHFSTPGDVVAAFIMSQDSPSYPLSAISMGPSRFLKIPRKNYREFWMADPDLILRVQNLLSTRMSSLQSHKAMTKSPLSQKVALLLLDLLERQPKNENNILNLPLTRKEIADSLGASVETVIRIMSEWSKLGYIQTTDQQINILNIDQILKQSRDT